MKSTGPPHLAICFQILAEKWQVLRAHPMVMAHTQTADIITHLQSDACYAKSTPVNRAHTN